MSTSSSEPNPSHLIERSHWHASCRPSRHSVRIPGQIVRVRDFQLVADTIVNLSTWGALVGPADPVLTGEQVYASFRLPGADDWLDAMGVVTRVVHGRRPSEHQRQLGIEFTDLGPHDRYRIRRALESLPLAPPGARLGRRARVDLGVLLAAARF